MIKHKPTDYSTEGVRLSNNLFVGNKFVEKAQAAMKKFQGVQKPIFNDFLVVAGHTIWGQYDDY